MMLGHNYLCLGEYKKAIEYCEEGLRMFTKISYFPGVASNKRVLGNAYMSLAKYEMTIEYCKKALDINIQINDKKGTAEANANLGEAYFRLVQFEKAINVYNEALEICTAIDAGSLLARVYERLGNAHECLGNYSKAIKFYNDSLTINIAIKNQRGVASCNCNLGNAYRFFGEYKKAIDYCKKSLEIFTAIEDLSGIANSNANLGKTYRLLGEHERAIECYKRSLNISIAIDDLNGMASNYCNLGNGYFSVDDYGNAIGCYEKGLATSAAIGDGPGIAANSAGLGNAFCSLGKYKKGIEYYKNGLEISSEVGDQKGIANFHCNLGSAYGSLGEFQKAVDNYKKSLEISTSIGDKLGMEISKSNLVIAYSSLEKYDESNEYLKRGLEVHSSTGEWAMKAKSNDDLGFSYNLNKYKEAIDCFTRSLEISKEIGYQSGVASSNMHLGDAYFNLGEYDKAMECYNTGIIVSTAIDDKLLIAGNYSNLGNVYNCLGEYNEAIKCYQKGLVMSTALGYQSGIANSTTSIGIAYTELGEYEKAIEHYQKSLEISIALKDSFLIARNYCNLGVLYYSLGEFEKAIEYSKRSLENSTDQSLISKNNCNMGNAYRSLGEYKDAIYHHNESLIICEAIGDQSGMAANIGNLGNAYVSLGEYDKAVDNYEKCLKINKDIGDQSGIAIYSCNLGNAYRFLRQFKKAISFCEEGIERSRAIGSSRLLGYGNGSLGHIYHCLEKHEIASSCLEKGISSFDKTFLESVPEDNKLSFTGVYFCFHEILMSCFISLGRNESGLIVVDLGRAKELHLSIERKQNSLDADLFSYACTLWDRIKNKKEQEEIEQLQGILQVENNETSILVFAFDLECSLIVWILNSSTTFRVPEPHAHSKTFGRLINELFQRLRVTIKEDSSFFKLDQFGDVYSKMTLPLEMPCKHSKRECLAENIPHKTGLNDKTILKKLFMLLIDPVKDVLKGNKIIIVPDKHLFFVPFCSLIDENDCYLSQSYSIQITPSLHTLRLSMERSRGSVASGFALFVGNPAVGKVSLNGSEFEPASVPKAAEEVACLSKLFTTRPLVRGEAKKHVVLGLLSGASIIHIAAHGEPKRGEIMLAPSTLPNSSQSPVPKQDCYLLTQKDITSISLQARLVVLSCCDTGQGEISSEGVIGIARSFLAAGARSVIATLWPINDDATKEFMKAFYHELLQETSVCEALRRVMNFFQQHESEAYRSFSIWAPFTVYGEDVMFTKCDIKMVREKSNEKLPECSFALFVGNPTSNLPSASEEVNSLSQLFKSRAFVEDEARKQVLLGLLFRASIIHISAHIEPTRCEIMLSSTLPQRHDLLTQQDIQELPLKARLVVLCLYHAVQDEVSPEGLETLALSFISAGARCVLSTLWPIDNDATTEFIETFYYHLLHESSVREALEKVKEFFQKHDKEAYRSFAVQTPFSIYGEDVMFQKHDVETIREKSREMFSGFVILPNSPNLNT